MDDEAQIAAARIAEVVRFLTFERHLLEQGIARQFFATPRDLGLALKVDAERRFEASAHSQRPPGLVLIAR